MLFLRVQLRTEVLSQGPVAQKVIIFNPGLIKILRTNSEPAAEKKMKFSLTDFRCIQKGFRLGNF